MAATNYNARLTGDGLDLPLRIIEFGTGYSTTAEYAKTRMENIMYPKHVLQDDAIIVCQMTSPKEKDDVILKLQNHVRRIMARTQSRFVSRLEFPTDKISYDVILKKVPCGLERFEVAPILILELEVVRDRMDLSIQIADISGVSGKSRGLYWWDDAGSSIPPTLNQAEPTNYNYEEQWNPNAANNFFGKIFGTNHSGDSH